MRYTVETTYPYEFVHCETLTEARRQVREFKKKGKRASIIAVTENGNDYIVESTSDFYYRKREEL